MLSSPGFTSEKLLGIEQTGLALATVVAVHDRIGLRERVEPPPRPAPQQVEA